MRKTALFLAATTALMLAACGSEQSGEAVTADGKKGEYTVDTDSGETSMTINGASGPASMRSGATVPLSLPPEFALLPGTTVTNNTVVNQPDGQGTMVMFESPIAAGKVIAHYRRQAVAAGYEIQLEMNTNGTALLGAERKADGTTMTVTARPGESAPTTGQIIIGTKKGG